MPNYACHKHHLHWLGAQYLIKASCEISATSLTDFLRKGRKSSTHILYIILLINLPLYNLLEKIIFDLRISIDMVHHGQISSHSDYCITSNIIWKTPKMPKNDQVTKIAVQSLLYSQNQIFPGYAVFARCYIMLSFIMYMKFQNILVTGCRDVDK